MKSILKYGPCHNCGDCRSEADTGAAYCRAHPLGELECEKTMRVDRLLDRAVAVAELVAKERDRDLRHDEALRHADSYCDLACELDAEFDEAAFLARCQVHVHEAVAA